MIMKTEEIKNLLKLKAKYYVMKSKRTEDMEMKSIYYTIATHVNELYNLINEIEVGLTTYQTEIEYLEDYTK